MGTEWKITNDRPIYLQLTEQIVQRIVSGQYPPASKLPSVRELAVEAGVNPNTMQRAFAELEREGLVTTNRTAGRIVTEDKEMIENIRGQLAAQKIEEFLEGMELLGFNGPQAAKLPGAPMRPAGAARGASARPGGPETDRTGTAAGTRFPRRPA